MDGEYEQQEDYADLDLPPPRRLPSAEAVFALLGLAFLVVVVALLLALWVLAAA